MNEIRMTSSIAAFRLLVVEEPANIFADRFPGVATCNLLNFEYSQMIDFSSDGGHQALDQFDLVILILEKTSSESIARCRIIQWELDNRQTLVLHSRALSESVQFLAENGSALCLPLELMDEKSLQLLVEVLVTINQFGRNQVDSGSIRATRISLEGPAQVLKNDNKSFLIAEFLASIAHDLKSPLHGILSFSGFGIRKIDQLNRDKLLDYLGKIQNCAHRILNLVNDVVDLANLEAGLTTYDYHVASISELLRIAINEQSALLEQKNITVSFLPKSFDDGAEVDSQRILQVCTNLISNAVKFSECGETISIAVDDQMDSFQVTIADNGIGLGQMKPEEFFDKYTHVNKPRSTDDSTGMGLAICRQIVVDHGGTIRVEENQDKGLKVVFTLPKTRDFGNPVSVFNKKEPTKHIFKTR